MNESQMDDPFENSYSRDLMATIRRQFIMSVTDAKGRIIEVNDAFCRISQYSRSELLGQNHNVVSSWTHEPSFFPRMWSTILRGESWRGEICNRAKNGSLYWVDSTITPLKNGHGHVERFISIRTDITERKRREERLLKHQSVLDRTEWVAGVGGWEVDIASGHIYWSEETCRIHGVPPDYEPTLDEAINFYAPDARPKVEQAVSNAINTGEGWDLELPFIKASGEHIWVRAVGAVQLKGSEPIRLFGAFQEITERVQQRALLEQAHARISLAANSGKIGIWEYDLREESLHWDERMYQIYGIEPQAATQTYALWLQHLHPEDREAAEQAVRDAITGVGQFDTEFRILRGDGQVRHVRGTALVERDLEGAPRMMVGVNWDVTRVRTMTEALAKQHELMRVTLESIGDAVITTDASGIVQWLNPVAQRMTGWTTEESAGRPLTDVFHLVDEKTLKRAHNPVEPRLLSGDTTGTAEHSILISRDGTQYGIEDLASPIRNEQGTTLGAVLVFRDVSEQRRLVRQVSYQARHDELTGLVNRRAFESQLTQLLEAGAYPGYVHALMFIDLDRFKLINDTCGHAIGDLALKQVGKLLSSVVRSHDTVGRLGGDEFGVILEHCTAEQAQRVAQGLCDKMDDFRFTHEEHRFRVGASVGLVTIDQRWSEVSLLLQAADKACYVAKEAGRSRVHIFSESDSAIQTRDGEMQWTRRIENALDEGRFDLYVQRLSNVKKNNQKVHAEILLRMRDADGSIVPPGQFFPAAERFHLASRIDKWVLRETLAWLNAQAPAIYEDIERLSINLSGQSISDSAFHRYATGLFSELESAMCRKICLEITETAAITNLADASSFIDDVSAFGVKVALDDFGAGVSSFGYLKRLRVDVLKIDGQFIQNLLTDPLDKAAVRCFVDVARVANLETVAEFVDKPELLSCVRDMGVDYAQGFFIHQPEPIDSFFQSWCARSSDPHQK